MGFLDTLFGRTRTRTPTGTDRLFAMSSAHVTLEIAHDIRTRGTAAIVFQPVATADFDEIAAEMEAIVRGTGEETGTALETSEDRYGYRWMILRDAGVEDLVVGVNAVSGGLETGGYGDRVLCAVFAFTDGRGAPLYFIYNYRRAAWYPFVPGTGEQERNAERELQLQAIIGTELPMEPELERWFPLWGIPI